MKTFLLILQLLVSIALIALILLQSSKGGLSGGMSSGEQFRSRRGAERIVFTLTVICSVLFFLLSIINLLTA